MSFISRTGGRWAQKQREARGSTPKISATQTPGIKPTGKGVADAQLSTALIRIFPFTKEKVDILTENDLRQLTTSIQVIEMLGPMTSKQVRAIIGTVKRFCSQRHLPWKNR